MFMTEAQLLSRKQMVEISGVDNDTLGFWMRQPHLLENQVEGTRKHRRYTVDEAKIATILGEAHSYGMNIAALTSFARLLRDGHHVWIASGKRLDKLADEDWGDGPDREVKERYWNDALVGANLANCEGTLVFFRQGEEYRVEAGREADSLPSTSALVFDLKRLLARFRSGQ